MGHLGGEDHVGGGVADVVPLTLDWIVAPLDLVASGTAGPAQNDVVPVCKPLTGSCPQF